LTRVESILQVAVIAGEIAVFALLVYRNTWRTLPWFCAYLGLTVADGCVNYAVAHYWRSAYFNTYFVGNIIDSTLQFCVMVELAWSVFRPFRASLPKHTIWFLAGFFAIAGAVIWPFAENPAYARFPHEWQLLGRFVQTDSILRVLLFLVLAGCSQLLSIGWRDRELQIATGLGFYSLVALGISAFHAHMGPTQSYRNLDEMLIGCYIGALAYWVFSFAQQEAERREFSPQMQGLLLAMAGAARGSRVALTGSSTGKSRSRKDL